MLLTWAIKFVEREADQLERCFRDANGEIHPEDVAIDVADARRWLILAKEALK